MSRSRYFIVAVIILLLSIAGWFYWQHNMLYPSTDDAYLKANVIEVAPQVSGRIVELDVVSHQHVEKGQVLLKVDSLPYQYALDQSQAAYDLASKQVSVLAASVISARSNLQREQASLTDTKSHARRMRTLVNKGLVNKDEADHADALFQQSRAAVNAARSELEKAIKALGKDDADNADIRKAAAALSQAKYDLENTTIVARHSGVLGNVDIRVGNVVRVNQALFPMVEDHEYWIEANFKETDIRRILTGQSVEIKLDMYPDVSINGVVESVSPASGASFSLLPPENATGNWVKVTQRFSVRIHVLVDENLPELRIGSSASVKVDTKKKSANQ